MLKGKRYSLASSVVQISLKLFWVIEKRIQNVKNVKTPPQSQSTNPFFALCFTNQKTKSLGRDKYLDVLFLYICKGFLALNSNIFHVSRPPRTFERTYNGTFANGGTLLTITYYLKSPAYKEGMHDSWISRRAAPICTATLDRAFS